MPLIPGAFMTFTRTASRAGQRKLAASGRFAIGFGIGKTEQESKGHGVPRIRNLGGVPRSANLRKTWPGEARTPGPADQRRSRARSAIAVRVAPRRLTRVPTR